ncbi:MAG TPA: glycosyltransferase [Anaerolineae bacterium]|nr:glycosyltransferase [Anaerolineae bacterium]
MIDIFVTITVIYSILYISVALIIACGESRHRSGELSRDVPMVSVIVCARNEEGNIHRCLDSLRRLDYPRDKLEILLVDDESEDRTLDIFKEYTARDGVFRVLTTFEEPQDLPAKQRPLDLGIRHARGEIVIVTDADCTVRPGWIGGHISAFRGNTGIVGGITKISTDSGGLFSWLQNCDQVSKLAVAMGCAGLGFPVTLMGNNFSFRRKVYESLGGFRKLKPSIVEDMALMNAVIRGTEYRLSWAHDMDSVAVSEPVFSFDTFIEQHLRWIHELRDLSITGKMMIGVEMLMTSIFWISLILALWNPSPLVLCTFSWVLAYFFIMTPTPGTGKKDMLTIPAMLLFQMYYSSILGFHALFKERKVTWKGRLYGKE